MARTTRRMLYPKKFSGRLMTLVNGYLTFVIPLVTGDPLSDFSEHLILRSDRNCVHLGHHLAGMDLVTQECRFKYRLT